LFRSHSHSDHLLSKMSPTTAVLVSSIKAMGNIFLVSTVGYVLALYPSKNPILPPAFLKLLSRLSMTVLAPCLIFSTVSSTMTPSLLSSSLPLIGFSVLQFFVLLLLSRLFRCLHPDQRMARIVEIAAATPNQISLPLMVLGSMCKSPVISEGFSSPTHIPGEVADEVELQFRVDECSKTSMGLVFIFAIGFYVTFWGYGIGVFRELRTAEQRRVERGEEGEEEGEEGEEGEEEENRTGEEERERTKREGPVGPVALKHLPSPSRCVEFLKRSLLNHMTITIYVSILAAVVPGVQSSLHSRGGSLEPLGDAIRIVSDPLIAINCFVMSGSLALTGRGGKRRGRRMEEGEKAERGEGVELVFRRDDANDGSSSGGGGGGADGDGDGSKEETDSDEVIAIKPPFITIFLHSFLRLVAGPAVMLPLLFLAVNLGLIGKEERLIQLIIAVEAAAPSAQMMIIALNQLGVQDLAGGLAYMYVACDVCLRACLFYDSYFRLFYCLTFCRLRKNLCFYLFLFVSICF